MKISLRNADEIKVQFWRAYFAPAFVARRFFSTTKRPPRALTESKSPPQNCTFISSAFLMDKARTFLLDKSFQIAFGLTLVFLSIGFAMLHFGWTDYGWAFFILLPVLVGFGIGAYPRGPWTNVGWMLGLLLFIGSLLALGLEGMVCVLMALVIIVPAILLGLLLGYLARRYGLIKVPATGPMLLLPFAVFLFGNTLEKNLPNAPVIREVRTTILLPYSPMQVYDAIKSVDTLDVPKPFLLKIGLPVPQKCVLETEAVGGLRTCYFEGGKIEERITELEPGRILKMDVTHYELTGRKWLGFQEAIYTFEPVNGNQTRLTRVTTYTSELNPRIYWEPLERWGIEQEHDYVFRNLQKDLSGSPR